MVGSKMTCEKAFAYEQELIKTGKLDKTQAGIKDGCTHNGRSGYRLRRKIAGWNKKGVHGQFVYANTQVYLRGNLAKTGYNYWSEEDRELDAKRDNTPRHKTVKKKDTHKTDKTGIVKVRGTRGHI